MKNTIIYEQPLNELIRACLRLEYLFLQLDHQIQDTSLLGTRFLINTLIQILQILDRPDLKAKLAKELGQHLTQLSRLKNTGQIDNNELGIVLTQLDKLMRCFIDSSGKLANNLRNFEMLNNLRLQLTTPGGACSFDIPVYHFWLAQPHNKRMENIKSWLSELENIRSAVFIVLRLLREGSKIQERSADNGFYQELLDPQMNLKLIRVGISDTLPAFPEISVGRHFLSIRFFSPTSKRALRVTQKK